MRIVMRVFMLLVPLILTGVVAVEAVELIKGLDGGDYERYPKSTIQWVQKVLKDGGLYKGEADGVLKKETMEAVAAFQKQQKLHVSGIPSPKTREALKAFEAEIARKKAEEERKAKEAAEKAKTEKK